MVEGVGVNSRRDEGGQLLLAAAASDGGVVTLVAASVANGGVCAMTLGTAFTESGVSTA